MVNPTIQSVGPSTGPSVHDSIFHGPVIHSSTPTVHGPSVCDLSVQGPTVCGPSVHGPTVHGPSVCDLSVQGPTICGPSVQGPFVRGPTVRGPSVHGPSFRAWDSSYLTPCLKWHSVLPTAHYYI